MKNLTTTLISIFVTLSILTLAVFGVIHLFEKEQEVVYEKERKILVDCNKEDTIDSLLDEIIDDSIEKKALASIIKAH